MDITVTELPDRRAVAVAHVGPYEQIGAAFDRLHAWLVAHRDAVAAPALAIYVDDPDSTPAQELRSYAVVPIAPDVDLDPEQSSAAGVQELALPGGRFAVGVHRGSYAGLSRAWSQIMESVGAAGLAPDWPRACLEAYATEPGTVPEDQLLTELYVPIQ